MRFLQKLMPKTPEQTRKLEKVRDQCWGLYRDQKLWTQKPSKKAAPVLAERFDSIFRQSPTTRSWVGSWLACIGNLNH